jgi:hypothetical protein
MIQSIGGHSINIRINNTVPLYMLLLPNERTPVDSSSSLLFIADVDAILSLVTKLDLPDDENSSIIAYPSGSSSTLSFLAD